MNLKKVGTGAVLISLMAVGGGIAAAQDGARGRGPRPGGQFPGEIMALITEQTGLEAPDILAQIRDGSSLSDVIVGNGGDVDVVIDWLGAQAFERIEGALERGAEGGRGERGRARPGLQNRFFGARGILGQVVEATGLEPGALREALQDGATLADVLTDNGVEVQDFIDEIADNVEQRLDQAVENGRIDQERADELLENFEATLADRLNTAPQRPAGQA